MLAWKSQHKTDDDESVIPIGQETGFSPVSVDKPRVFYPVNPS
jgi:hypothetical protein